MSLSEKLIKAIHGLDNFDVAIQSQFGPRAPMNKMLWQGISDVVVLHQVVIDEPSTERISKWRNHYSISEGVVIATTLEEAAKFLDDVLGSFDDIEIANSRQGDS